MKPLIEEIKIQDMTGPEFSQHLAGIIVMVRVHSDHRELVHPSPSCFEHCLYVHQVVRTYHILPLFSFAYWLWI